MALDSFKRDFGLEGVSSIDRDTLQGNIVSTFQAGTFFGALLTFPIGERYGRRKAILASSLIFLLGGALMVRDPDSETKCLVSQSPVRLLPMVSLALYMLDVPLQVLESGQFLSWSLYISQNARLLPLEGVWLVSLRSVLKVEEC